MLDGRGDWADWRGRAARHARRRRASPTSPSPAATAPSPSRARSGPACSWPGPVAAPRRPDHPGQSRHHASRIAAPTSGCGLQQRARSRSPPRAWSTSASNRFENLRVADAAAPARRDRAQPARPRRAAGDGPQRRRSRRPASPTICARAASPSATTTIEGLRAVGSARVRADDIVIPVSARASRILGFDAVAGGPLANVRMDGEIGIAGTRLVSDNLHAALRPDRRARWRSPSTSPPAATSPRVQGRVNNYLVDGVGLFDVTTDLDMVSEARRLRPARPGRGAHPADRQCDGRATCSAAPARSPPTSRWSRRAWSASTISALAAPLLRDHLGRRHLPARTARSTCASPASAATYGPLAVLVTGTRERAADRGSPPPIPGFGIGLRDVTRDRPRDRAGLGDRGDRRIRPTGRSAPTSSSSRSRGPLTIAVNRLTFAGIDFAGPRRPDPRRAVRRHARPWPGRGSTAPSGSAAAGRYQRIDVAATRQWRAHPGRRADHHPARPRPARPSILTPTRRRSSATPSSPGSAAATCSSSGRGCGSTIAAAAARAQLFAEGRRGVPVPGRRQRGAGARPDPRRDAGPGQQHPVPLRPAGRDPPRVGGGWRLAPVTVALAAGPDPARRPLGRRPRRPVAARRPRPVDPQRLLAGPRPRRPATGSLDFAQPGRRRLPARRGAAQHRQLHPHRHRRPLGRRSNIALAGKPAARGRRSSPRSSAAAAASSAGSQARLQPLGPAAGVWPTRLLAAPLAGGIRYNGPADVPMSLRQPARPPADRPDRRRRRFQRPGPDTRNSPASSAPTTSPTSTRPMARGSPTSRSTAASTGSRLEIDQLSRPRRARHDQRPRQHRPRLGGGLPDRPQARVRRTPSWRAATISARPPPAISPSPTIASGASITGELELGEVRYQIVRQAAAEVPQLAGVRRRGEPLPPPGAERADAGVPSIWQLDLAPARRQPHLRLRHGPRIRMADADLRVQGTTATPRSGRPDSS